MPGYRAYNITMNPDGKTAYLNFGWSIGSSFSDSIVPISTATNTAGQPIRVYSGKRPFVAGIVFSPGGKTAYVAAGSLGGTPFTLLNPATVTPINAATNTPGQPIRLRHGVSGIAITPDGKTVYADSGGGDGHPGYVTRSIRPPARPVRRSASAPGLAPWRSRQTGRPSTSRARTRSPRSVPPPARLVRRSASAPGLAPWRSRRTGRRSTPAATGPSRGAVIPISTATNRAGQPIPFAAEDIAITPDGKTLYAAARQGVVPISTATNTPGKPIRPAG